MTLRLDKLFVSLRSILPYKAKLPFLIIFSRLQWKGFNHFILSLPNPIYKDAVFDSAAIAFDMGYFDSRMILYSKQLTVPGDISATISLVE